jgi:serine/threonine-protein kinase
MLVEFERFVRDKLTAEAGQIFVAGGREYTLAGNLGNGAIGVVRKARDRKTDQQVAVKFLAPELRYIEESSLDDIYARFRREGYRGAALSHKHLVKIIAYEENEGGSCFPNGDGPCNPFIIMDYVHGTTLEHYIQGQQKLGPHFNFTRRTLYIAYAIADALAYLHENERKIVHRDVKPGNIFFTKGLNERQPDSVKLGDFGVVKWGDFKASLTSGTITLTNQKGLGTWKYMSPEQATKPKEVSVRSDMYSLGITLFELFTNQIFPTQHHIFQIAQQRLQRTDVTGKLYELGLGMIHPHFEDLFKCIYDMFLTSPAGRPTSSTVRGKLRYLLETLYPDTVFE